MYFRYFGGALEGSTDQDPNLTNHFDFIDLLVKAWSVGVLVLLYDGDVKGDKFRPEVQVLNAGTLLIWRDALRLGIRQNARVKL